jgi:hypothetical protein
MQFYLPVTYPTKDYKIKIVVYFREKFVQRFSTIIFSDSRHQKSFE